MGNKKAHEATSKNGLIIFVEGETEIEFYKKILDNLKTKCSNVKFPYDKLIWHNLKGITNFKTKALRVFTSDVEKYRDIIFDVLLCYDADVPDYSSKPPVNMKSIERSLLGRGARKVVHIKAEKCIEDWFLYDIEGILRYLNLPSTTKLQGADGVHKLCTLFKKANKLYIKGNKVDGLVDVLNTDLILSKICMNINGLCMLFGIDCSNNKKCQ